MPKSDPDFWLEWPYFQDELDVILDYESLEDEEQEYVYDAQSIYKYNLSSPAFASGSARAYKECKFCGVKELHWEQTETGGWRLHDADSVMHVCKMDRGK